MKQRAIGVTIVGAVLLVAPAFLCYEALRAPWQTVQAYVMMGFVGFFSLLTGIGLLMLRNWAWRLALLEAGLGVVSGGAGIILLPSINRSASQSMFELMRPSLTVITLSALVLLYFLRPSVKVQFRAKQE